ncbi:type VII secretion-associated serine protease mycosin [Streptomyces ossamyceticus]|uniref:type VII secretion-associated serine protease mycosin n=1 Tax=Streptomyces ossamyceticus TaxID=249581 RepID=UPI00342D33CC
MGTATTRGSHRAATAAIFGMLLVGVAGAPAHAESIRERQWFLDAMQAEQIWQTSTGKGITVAVIDSGVDLTTPDLEGQVLQGKDYAGAEPGDEHADYEGHGTGMAALIAGTGAYNGGQGSFGLAPSAKILPIRMPKAETAANVAEANRQFNDVAPKAIRYAVDAGAQVINISMGHTEGSQQLSDAVKYALNKGALIFAAVGNSGDEGNKPEYPAATPGVVGVGAVGKDLHKTAESQYGPQVDMAAPGQEMVAACGSGTGFCKSHGTSDATALASASAALIWSNHPTWTNNQVLRVMLNTIGAPTDGTKRNDSIGYGIVRPRVALKNPGDPGPADEYPLPDLAAAPSASPSPDPSAADAAGSSAEGNAENAANQSDDGALMSVMLGGLAVAVLGGAAAGLAITRKRRAKQIAIQMPADRNHHHGTPQPLHRAAQYPTPPYAPPGAQTGNATPRSDCDSV